MYCSSTTKNPAFAGSLGLCCFFLLTQRTPLVRGKETKEKSLGLHVQNILIDGFYFVKNGIEYIRIVDDKICKCFPIKLNIGFFEFVYK